MSRLDQKRQKELEPQRMRFAKDKIEDLGLDVEEQGDTCLKFNYKDEPILFYPYSGWATGKTIEDGRGLHRLLVQLNSKG